MKIQKANETLFYELETKLHRKDTRNSIEQTSKLLADEFIEFGSSGLKYDKETTLESLSKESIDLEITVQDFQAKHLSEDVVLVTYKTSKIHPESRERFESLRSSIWKLEGDQWKMIFHQGTKIPS